MCLYLFFYYGFCERKINWTKDISGGHKGFGKLGTSLILDLSIFFADKMFLICLAKIDNVVLNTFETLQAYLLVGILTAMQPRSDKVHVGAGWTSRDQTVVFPGSVGICQEALVKPSTLDKLTLF